MVSDFERSVPLEGASNFRDFGGYRTPTGVVRSGLLYRSERLSNLTAADFDTLNARGIRLIVDLRRQSERESDPTRWRGDQAPEQIHVPLLVDRDGPSSAQRIVSDPEARTGPERATEVMRGLYRSLVREPATRQRYRVIFERIVAGDGLPVVIHCSGGKDRTGVLAALIHSALGVSRDDILEDFMLTTQFYDGLARLRERAAQIYRHELEGWSADALGPLFTVHESYLHSALSAVDEEFGSAFEFLTAGAGIPASSIDRLRALLIE